MKTITRIRLWWFTWRTKRQWSTYDPDICICGDSMENSSAGCRHGWRCVSEAEWFAANLIADKRKGVGL